MYCHNNIPNQNGQNQNLINLTYGLVKINMSNDRKSKCPFEPPSPLNLYLSDQFHGENAFKFHETEVSQDLYLIRLSIGLPHSIFKWTSCINSLLQRISPTAMYGSHLPFTSSITQQDLHLYIPSHKQLTSLLILHAQIGYEIYISPPRYHN